MIGYPRGTRPKTCIAAGHTVTTLSDGFTTCSECPAFSSANTPEPPPTAGTGPDIWPLVIADLPEGSPLRADMQERHEQGIAKYGVPLRAFNGRNAMVDAYQEALDLVVYLRQALEETYLSPDKKHECFRGLNSRYTEALELAKALQEKVKAA